MPVTKGSARATRPDRIVVPRRGATIVAGDGGSLTLHALDDGCVRAEPDPGMSGAALLRIDEPTELHDGDVLRAGRQWMSFDAGRNGRPGRLCLLDASGETHLGIGLRGRALSLGRESGDVVMPWDDSLAELHLQLLVRRDGTFVQHLAATSGTWVVVRAGEVLIPGSVLAISGRLVQVSTPPQNARRAEDGRARKAADDRVTRVFVAA